MTDATPRLEFERAVDVSRETIDRLQIFVRLVEKWNRSINLIGQSTMDDLWSRHIRESAAVFELATDVEGDWVDLGSGAGFPGAAVAILAAERSPKLAVTCIEADIRKSAFLRTVSRETGVSFGVLSRRIEEAPARNAAVLSARALAPLDKLLGYCERHLSKDGTAILPKGERWEQEVATALESWSFTLDKAESPIHTGSAILIIRDIARV